MPDFNIEINRLIQIHVDTNIDIKKFRECNNIKMNNIKVESVLEDRLFKIYVINYYQTEFNEIIKNIGIHFKILKTKLKEDKIVLLPIIDIQIIEMIEMYIIFNQSFLEFLSISVHNYSLFNEVDYKITSYLQYCINNKVITLIKSNINIILNIISKLKRKLNDEELEYYNNLPYLVDFIEQKLNK
jgi:hypothetical protein